MQRQKLEFDNGRGQRLSGLMELPDGKCHAVALFAHCFTCGKDIAAASRISRALAARGVGVLRFDFTGLGSSDGDFANTNFSSNVDDLIAAANHLAATYFTPSMLIGHSLGGAAVLAAAGRLADVRAVVTIGAPATASHVQHLFAKDRDRILEADAAEVDLGGRAFTIKRQFIEDIEKHADTQHLAQLGSALLVFHSPRDTIVPIDEAARIYQSARHPKSFVSLDSADHLLSKVEDAEYVADVIAAWANRYLPKPDNAQPAVDDGAVLVKEANHRFTREIVMHRHSLIADEPASVKGDDRGPNPYELLLSALGACTSMTLRMYANHKSLNLDDVRVTLRHNRVHADDCADCESASGYIDWITREIEIDGDLTPAERKRLLEIADRCPVHRTLENEIVVSDKAPPPKRT